MIRLVYHSTHTHTKITRNIVFAIVMYGNQGIRSFIDIPINVGKTHFLAIVVIDVPLPCLYILSSDIYMEHKLTQTMTQMLLSMSLSSLIRLYKQTHERSEQILLHTASTCSCYCHCCCSCSQFPKTSMSLNVNSRHTLKPNFISLNNQLWFDGRKFNSFSYTGIRKIFHFKRLEGGREMVKWRFKITFEAVK